MPLKPTLHLLGIFHTVHSPEYSHCAFTGKALRFSKMMQAQGYPVIEYANEGSESAAQTKVPMLTQEELRNYIGDKQGGTKFFGDTAQIGSGWHEKFEARLISALRERLDKHDIICHPFGRAHGELVKLFPRHCHVETGIGYPELLPGAFKIFESYAWMHYHQGKENRKGHNYEWVIPNYFDLDEWEPATQQGTYIAFMSRICAAKGMDTVFEIAKRVNMPIKIAGQGDPTPWKHPNIEYVGPLKGKERSEFLKHAYCQLLPTQFVEPFGGAGVEGLLCGTPLIASDFGAFTETVTPGFNGYRCHVLKQWLGAIAAVQKLDRQKIADAARARYSLRQCGVEYDAVFRQVDDLRDEGWYTLPPAPGAPNMPFRAPTGPLPQAFIADVTGALPPSPANS
jgi:hypothetical protein